MYRAALFLMMVIIYVTISRIYWHWVGKVMFSGFMGKAPKIKTKNSLKSKHVYANVNMISPHDKI